MHVCLAQKILDGLPAVQHLSRRHPALDKPLESGLLGNVHAQLHGVGQSCQVGRVGHKIGLDFQGPVIPSRFHLYVAPAFYFN